jgi:ethanolamine-phosphate phospho-lyase
LYAEEVRALCKEAKKNGRTVAAFIAESLQSCGGQVIPPANFMKNVYKCVFELSQRQK